MWRSVLLLGIVIALPASGWADTVEFSVDPANIGAVYAGHVDVDLFSSDLNGTALGNKTLSLNLVFNDDVLARLLLSDPPGLGVALELLTLGEGPLAFDGPSTGFLLDANGNQVGDTQVAGEAFVLGPSDGFDVGLVSFNSDNLGGTNKVDISGAHFDISFPANGFVVTSAKLRFALSSDYNSLEFGTAQELPEPSSLLLLGSGLIGLVGLGRRKLSACP
jgi:PEP-CTERM motif